MEAEVIAQSLALNATREAEISTVFSARLGQLTRAARPILTGCVKPPAPARDFSRAPRWCLEYKLFTRAIVETLDQELKTLAIAAQQQPAKSAARRIALARLLKRLQTCGRLTRPFRGMFRGYYEDIYAEAMQRLFVHVCEKIDQYDPNREVLQWVNFLLRRRFFVEACREVFPHYQANAGETAVMSGAILSLDDLTSRQMQTALDTATPSLTEQVRACLHEDPDRLFRSTYVADQPAANFQYLACRLLDGYKWRELAAELDIPIPTLSSFYQRNLKRFAPKLQAYLT